MEAFFVVTDFSRRKGRGQKIPINIRGFVAVGNDGIWWHTMAHFFVVLWYCRRGLGDEVLCCVIWKGSCGVWTPQDHARGWEAVVIFQGLIEWSPGRNHFINQKHGEIVAMLILFFDMGYANVAEGPGKLCITRYIWRRRTSMIRTCHWTGRTLSWFVRTAIMRSITVQM